MDLDPISWSKFPISRTDLESYASVVVLGKHYQMISDTVRIVESIPFATDCDSIHQVPVVDDSIR